MMEAELIFNDERERKILQDAMERLDMSATAVIRRWCRMGQLVDHQIQQGYKLAWVKNGEVVDPFDMGPKMAPMPEDLSRLDDDGGAQPPAPARSCNRHDNCDEAEERAVARNPGMTRADIHTSFHCHDEECEDCFGS
jgi:hypothetical protein